MEKDEKWIYKPEKIIFIQEFLKLESEVAISHLEKLLQKETKTETSFQPMTMQEFQGRINQSKDDSEKGRITQAGDLLSQIDEWNEDFLDRFC